MQAPLFGVGFRTQHAAEIARAPGSVDWFEILSDHYLGVGGTRRALLERLRTSHPVALHGVSLSIAGAEPLDREYLAGLAALAGWLEPLFACTRAVLEHVAARVAHVQEKLRRPLLLENASAYVAFRAREMDEADFLAELVRRTGCGVLLDVNNLIVNAANLGSDPQRALEVLPVGAVGYLHLAGHAVLPDVRIDTHDADVPDAVWELFAAAARRFPAAGVIIERDGNLPSYETLAAEVEQARVRHRDAMSYGDRDAPQAGRSPARRSPQANEGASWPALQQEFFARIVDQPLGREQSNLSGLLDESLPVRAARGLRVYSDAYTASLRSALATNFAALARVLSPADFDRLAAAYLRAHPPHGFDYLRLGARFAAFVAGFDFAAGYGVPRAVLAELAALEQAQLEVQDAPDAERAVTPAELAALAPEAWERVGFSFAPAFRVLRATHDVAPVVEAVAAGKDPARPVVGDVAYLVSRAGDGVRTERLPPHEAALLEALLAGATFHAACSGDARAAEAGARRLVAAATAGLLVGTFVK